ncbi:chromosome segregation protein SMC [Virgibacillus sp. W0430]|uniref:chromosome segregation protein SMC n=1 Tax=Virgibacillus sp. W0430 TaxID=3391580 RepID=UPI003F47E839
MYLKRLESVGFKSFAERIRVEFVPGVTAVVGPNGSGKSNIIDAVRWVLGEQSAKSLRGAKMEDIIFQGSDTRKPLNFAEVTLVLDNEDQQLPLDYEEISVTRRVYRSGDSEFYLNKQSCRLKDIVDLFLDSGLGKEAFSIISQGKVEEILSSKAEERRIIFEEAAGVLKYKQRKRKAEFKLGETEENLDRVKDIIHEIEKQIEPLKEQAQTAKQYKTLKEQLKQKEIGLLLTEIQRLHADWQSLLTELEENKLQEIDVKTTIQKMEANIENERQQLNNLDAEIAEMQTELLAITQQLEQMEGNKNLLHERLKHFAENKEKLQLQQKSVYEKIELLQSELAIEQRELEAMQAKRNQTKKEIEDLELKLTKEEENIEDQIENMKADYIELLNKQAVKRNEKHSIEADLKRIQTKKSGQVNQSDALLATIDRQEEEKRTVKIEYENLQAACHDKMEYVQQLKKELATKRANYQQSQAQLYEGNEHIARVRSKKEMLHEMKEEFQGFFFGVKEVLQASKKNMLANIHGAVIELIDVPQQFITAIDTVLGAQTQYIVVADDEAARAAINWLKREKKGRATFLPLASIKQRYLPKDVLQKIRTHKGMVDVASALVSSRFDLLVNHLMGHVIVAKTLKDANEIAALTERKYRVVTLEGDVVNPGGSMSGGAQKRTNQSLFTRDKELQRLSVKLKEYEKRSKQFAANVQKEKEAIQRREELIDSEERLLSKMQDELQHAHASYKEMELKLASLNDNLTVYDLEKQQFERNVNKLKNRVNQLNNELNSVEQQLISNQQTIQELMDQQAAFKTNYEKTQQVYQAKRIEYAEQEERLKHQREKTEALKFQLKEQQNLNTSYTNDLIELIRMHESEKSETEMNESIQAKKQEKTILTEKIQRSREKQVKRNKWINDEERELKEISRQRQQLLQEIQQKEVKANRLDVALENRLSHLQTEYEITYDKAEKMYEKATNRDEAKQYVEQLKQSIDRLGTVNIGAIEEYERISKRYTFLTTQEEDLVRAKETLFTVISEMDEEMEQLFSATFTKIKAEFSHVFQQLFGGGYAELTLTDPQSILHTGVDIVARPPGKKLQSLGLLSGGERALTAIALLFAILRVRPVPFCILDEVEAALDEANVVRFAKYVKLYSEKTQFIVITHRKGTMEEADVLYGVTMQESGVSRLVSVRLEETEELINV